MKGLTALFLGIFGTFAFSWMGLTVIPNWQIGHLNPQSDEEGTDIYPMPQSGMVTRGARVYAANGCNYCHSEQVRAEYAGADIERKWGDRRSAPRDYVFERPVFLGKMRMGQDLANIGARAPKQEESSSAAGGASSAPQGAAGASPSPSGSASPGSAAATPTSPLPAAKSAPSPPNLPPGASPAAAAVVSGGSPPPAPPSGLASPSPGAMGTTAISSGAQPGTATAPSSGPQIAGPPWPEQTVGLPPMYSAAWHHVHLYSPRSINFDSNMPSYRFLYETRRISDARSSDALQLTGSDAPPQGWEIVPTYDAKCLVAYMMALNQSHPLKGVRSAGSPAAASPAASPSPASGGQPAK
jgi:cbb3-type cytochrome oxidase cytochrome c subunit